MNALERTKLRLEVLIEETYRQRACKTTKRNLEHVRSELREELKEITKLEKLSK